MRHAKSEPFATEDRVRSLTPRGHRDAAEAGAWLHARGVAPDHALVSSAVRTRETWADLAAALDSRLEPRYEDALYAGGTDTAMECLRAVPEDRRAVLFIGHNPTAGTLVQLLNDGAGDAAALRAASAGFPTSAVAVLTVTGDWADLELGSARITAVHVGRG